MAQPKNRITTHGLRHAANSSFDSLMLLSTEECRMASEAAGREANREGLRGFASKAYSVDFPLLHRYLEVVLEGPATAVLTVRSGRFSGIEVLSPKIKMIEIENCVFS